jgi:hypothetical protein
MMTPSDVTQLAVLGIADRCPTTLTEIVETARTLAPLDWQPTTDTIHATVERSVERRLAECHTPSTPGGGVLQTTPCGRIRILELLRTPLPAATGGFLRTCISVKACFLDHVPLLERGDLAFELAAVYRQARGIMNHLNQLPHPLAGTALRNLRAEIVRLDSEIVWLEAMAAWKPIRMAAE